MDFIFVCPKTQKTFTTPNFEIVDNRGVKTDADGNRMLDATVRLNAPCPFCGDRHEFHATELSCPFSADIP